MSFHRVVKGFVISRVTCRRAGRWRDAAESMGRQMKAEFNDQVHEKGTLSMARLAEPDSASTSFFIVTARAQALDGKYSAFGKVESGLDVVEKIEAVALNGEEPQERVELRKVTVVEEQRDQLAAPVAERRVSATPA